MKTTIDSHAVSVQVAEILWFYGVASRQSATTTSNVPWHGKTRYVIEVDPTDAEKAMGLFPLRKWEV